MERFVRASMKGWKWAEDNPEEAAMIVLDYDETGCADRTAPDPHDERGGQADGRVRRPTLLAGGSDPVITEEPEGAWSHAITDTALE